MAAMMRQAIGCTALLLFISIASCTTIESGDSDREELPAGIQFLDSDSFDTALSAFLKDEKAEVEVTMLARVTLNEVPERLDAWLFHVKDHYGGAVELVPEEGAFAGRGPAVAAGLTLAIKAYGMMRERLLYSPAQNYDALVYYEPVDGRMTRVVFHHRSAGSRDR